MSQITKVTKRAAIGLSLAFLTACGTIHGQENDNDQVRNDNNLANTITTKGTASVGQAVEISRSDWYKPIKGEFGGKLVLHKLVEEGNLIGVSQLLQQGYDPDAKDKFDRTAVHTLAKEWDDLDENVRSQIFMALQKHNADLFRSDFFGVRPLVMALMEGNDDLRDEILALGDDTNKPGKTKYGKNVYPVLKVAEAGPLDSFRYLIDQDVRLDVTDHEGRGVIEYITMAMLSDEDNIKKLKMVEPHIGESLSSYFTHKPDGLIEAFQINYRQKDDVLENSLYLRRRNDRLRHIVSDLDNQGFDFNRVVHSKTGETMAHKLAAYNNMQLLELLDKRGFRLWDHKNAHGATATDYALIYGGKESEEFLRSKNVAPTLQEIRDTRLTVPGLQDFVQQYGAGSIRTHKPLEPNEVNKRYRMYTELDTPPYKSGNMPVVVVTGVTMQPISIEHLDDTTTVVKGTLSRLSGHNSTARVLEFKTNPTNPEDLYISSGYHPAPLLLTGLLENNYQTQTPVIISHSAGYPFEVDDDELRKMYQERLTASGDRKSDYFLRLNPIGHYSNGNNGEGSCAPLEDDSKKETCFRSPSMYRASSRSVHVGAAERKPNGQWLVHDYSDSQPTYCAGLPYETDNKLFYGTSFSTPASAAVEAELFSLHGRSPSFPQGVSHEDIMLALHLTADRNIIDERTNHRLQFNENAAGVGISWRCGSGVINPAKASRLLQKMVRVTEYGLAKPTEYKNIEVSVNTNSARMEQNALFGQNRREGYVYEIRVPESGFATKPYIQLNFDRNNKGEAYLVSPRGTVSPLRPSLSGNVDTDNFWGERWQAGEVIKLVTSKPLMENGTRSFVRLAPPDSAFGYIAGQREQAPKNGRNSFMFQP